MLSRGQTRNTLHTTHYLPLPHTTHHYLPLPTNHQPPTNTQHPPPSLPTFRPSRGGRAGAWRACMRPRVGTDRPWGRPVRGRSWWYTRRRYTVVVCMLCYKYVRIVLQAAADAPADAPADAALADSATNHQPPITNHKPPTIHHITTIEPPTTNQSTNEPKDGTTWVKNLSHVIITNEVRYPF